MAHTPGILGCPATAALWHNQYALDTVTTLSNDLDIFLTLKTDYCPGCCGSVD